MKFIPSNNLEIYTELKPGDVHGILLKNTSVALFDSERPFKGKADQLGTFKIRRRINYRNSFIPIIHGTYQAQGSGTMISLKFRMYPVVIVFVIIWLTGISFFSLLALLLMLFEGEVAFFLVTIGLAILGYSLFHGAFDHELQKSKEALRNIFRVLH